MSGKDLKRNSYCLKDRNKKAIDVKRSKLKDPQTTEHLSKLKRKIEVCIFVAKCIKEAQQKKIMENAFKNLTASKDYSSLSMFSIS